MFELTVQTEFSAAHAILIRGERERNHGHNWRVSLVVAGETLDADGLLCDFHQVQAVLSEIIAPFRNADLNTTPPFDRVNPTAENVAKHIAVEAGRRLQTVLPPRAFVAAASVTEAVGCTATFRPPRPPHAA